MEAIDYFESNFPDLPKFAELEEGNKAEYLVSITTKVRGSSKDTGHWIDRAKWGVIPRGIMRPEYSTQNPTDPRTSCH